VKSKVLSTNRPGETLKSLSPTFGAALRITLINSRVQMREKDWEHFAREANMGVRGLGMTSGAGNSETNNRGDGAWQAPSLAIVLYYLESP